MAQNTSIGRYSAVVKLTLLAGGQVYPLAQVGPEKVILKTAARIPPGPATVVVVVDGNEHRTDVMLLESSESSDIIRTVRTAAPIVG
jgi:hypothetical protein